MNCLQSALRAGGVHPRQRVAQCDVSGLSVTATEQTRRFRHREHVEGAMRSSSRLGEACWGLLTVVLLAAGCVTTGGGLGPIKIPPIIDPGSVVSGAVDRLADAIGGSEYALLGDKRAAKNGAGLALTAEEQRAANEAAELFRRVSAAGRVSPQIPMWRQGTQQAATLERGLGDLVRRLPSSGKLSEAQRQQVREALQPFVLGHLLDIGEKAGLGPLIAWPKQVTPYDVAAYCSDPGTAGPKPGEEFQLKPLETLYPPELIPSLVGLLKAGAVSGGHDRSIQGLIWTIRRTATGQDITQDLRLSDQQQSLLRQADPNAIELLLNYYGRARGEQLKRDLIKRGLNRAAGKVTRSLSSASNSGVLADVQRISAQLDAMPVSGGVRGNNASFTRLRPTVAAQTLSSGGHKSARIALANDSAEAKVFFASSCVAQSTRHVQRLALQAQRERRISDGTGSEARFERANIVVDAVVGALGICSLLPDRCLTLGAGLVLKLTEILNKSKVETAVFCADGRREDSDGPITVYRVHGSEPGESRPNGEFWTPRDPRLVRNYRNDAGLPDNNPGTYLTVGYIDSMAVVREIGVAASVESKRFGTVFSGGLEEWKISNPEVNVKGKITSRLNPPL